MLLIEFDENSTDGGLNILKYRDSENDSENDSWYYLYIDIETLAILISNFGIISTIRNSLNICIDNEFTSKTINMKYCGAPISLHCLNKSSLYLPILEQPY